MIGFENFDSSSKKGESRTRFNKTVAILMATFNGLRWLPEQVNSILGQVEVTILLFISDDLSNDGTWEWLQELSNHDCRVILLPQTHKFGRAGANFYRLLLDADFGHCDYIAFSDQDDIWEPDKLSRQITIARHGNFDGVSSNVTAFWPDESSALITKSQAQRKLDYLFESAGPGCTFLMTPWLAGELRRILAEPLSCARDVALHDWLAYAVCRASGRTWYIDTTPTVRYRQHTANELGANYGSSAKFLRLKWLWSGWYRAEVFKIVKVCMIVSRDPDVVRLSHLLSNTGLIKRIRLLQYISEVRRRFVDRLVLLAAIMLFLF
jgi:rhamnosyltransferase